MVQRDIDQKRIGDMDKRYATCDKCGYTIPLPKEQGILHPDTGEPLLCPKCDEGIMRD